MATGTKIYNYEQQQIYPITDATVVISNSSGSRSDVETELVGIWKKIGELSGEEDITSSIQVKVSYCLSNTANEDDVKRNGQWTNSFSMPSPESPYAWKRTIFTYTGDTGNLNELYEIVATDLAVITQTIYLSTDTSTAPKIKYEILKDGFGDPILDENGEEQEDLHCFDKKLPEGWKETPISIGPGSPFVFMSTRKRIGGYWDRFSTPALFGRWAYDSQMEIRYTVTSGEVPEVSKSDTNPGAWWSEESPTSFTGKLWMITATSIGGQLNSKPDGTIWQGPHLLSIIQ